MNSPVKVPPHSIEAEQSVLGGLMLDNHAWDKALEFVSEADFYSANHRVLFQVMEELTARNQPIDVLTLMESLRGRKELERVGGEAYLFELVNNTPSSANIGAYAVIVRERAIQRQLIQAASTIVENSFNPDGKSISELLDNAEHHVFAIAERGLKHGEGPVKINQLLANAVERIEMLYNSEDAFSGLATGFYDFDDKTSGLQKADLIIVAGRPSMGKTTFAMNIAENVAIKLNKPVLVFSMEMPGESLATRILSSLGRIQQQAMRSGKLQDEDWPRIVSTVSMLSGVPLYIDDTPSLSPGELRSRARRMARENPDLGLIVVDYLQLMQVPGSKENRTAEISEISRALKSLARELKVPVLALSQLNRSLEQRADRRPMMSDLRESGAIEQDADLIVFIYRDEVYNEDTPEKGIAEIIIAKHRNGPTGKVKLTFKGEFTRFENHISAPLGYEAYG